uniref:Uncharacterized protein n=1 Tax=Manihot esculenta TaxID=3983 RepID=A0A2C9U4U2_MANES
MELYVVVAFRSSCSPLLSFQVILMSYFAIESINHLFSLFSSSGIYYTLFSCTSGVMDKLSHS